MDDFQLRGYTNQRNILIKVKGRVVMDSASIFKDRILALMVPPLDIINLDLAELEFLDSAALDCLIR